MTWEIKLTSVAEKQFGKLSKEHQNRIFKLFKKIEIDPKSDGKSLKGTGKLKLWCYRVGDYRLICQIINEELTILVIKIGHRRHIYEKMD